MAEFRKQYKVSTLTSTTGVTLIPVVGERTGGMAAPTSIELTYSVSPVQYRVVGKVIDIQLEVK